MDIKVALNNDIPEETGIAAPAGSEVVPKAGETDFVIDEAQEFLLKAKKDAELAKVIARQAINRAFQQNEVNLKRAEVLARAFDDALQGNFSQIHRYEKESAGSSGNGFDLSGYVKKLFNNGQHPLSAISDMTKSLSVNTEVDAETRIDFYNQVIRQSKQLRELIDDLVQQQIRGKMEKAVEEAKSDRIASKLAVQQAQDEIARAREEITRAQSEAETAQRDAEEAISIARKWVDETKREVEAERKAAEIKVSQAEQLAMSGTAEEVEKAKDEVTAAKEAARIAIRNAEAEARRSRQEAEATREQARHDVVLAQEKARQETEKAEVIRQQSQAAIDKALAEAAAAREEAEKVRRESEWAVSRACEESRRAIEKAEREKKQIQETVIEAEQQSYQDICKEMNRIKAEAEATRKSASESIKRAQEESRKAKEETDAVNKAAAAALARAAEETRQAREEAEQNRQALQEVVVRAQEENRQIKEEAEASILRANETMKNARRDIIGMTIGEITRTRQELEAASQNPGIIRDIPVPADKTTAASAVPSGMVDGDRIAAVLNEMRAPLHSISRFVNIMLEDDISDAGTQKELFSILVQQSESLNRLLNDLSGMVDPQSKKVDIEKEMVSPHQLVTEAVQSVRGMALQKKIVIILSIPGTLPAIEANVVRIKQVLLNLVTNAVKFSPENSAVIVRAEAREGELLIQVKYRGIGNPREHLAIVFEKGYRADNCGEVSGHGLGLDMCRQIVMEHGGRIWAESLEGQGSTFNLALPLAPVNS